MMYETETAVPEVVRRVRFMQRYFSEVVDADPELRHFLPKLHCAYMDRLNEEFAPHALDLALAVVKWEDREQERQKPVAVKRRPRGS